MTGFGVGITNEHDVFIMWYESAEDRCKIVFPIDQAASIGKALIDAAELARQRRQGIIQ